MKMSFLVRDFRYGQKVTERNLGHKTVMKSPKEEFSVAKKKGLCSDFYGCYWDKRLWNNQAFIKSHKPF